MSLVRLENVSKTFGMDFVLSGVNLRVEEGEKIGLIGRNGTGKSTIFRLITAETEPTRGLIERQRKLRIGALAQIPDTRPTATIHDVVMASFGELMTQERELRALEEEMSAGDTSVMERYSRLQEAFTVAGGYEFRTNAKRVLHGLGFRQEDYELHFNALSGGQRTRLMLALVLMHDADLLLLDEPENHLDLQAREWLENFLKDWPRAFIVISHDRQMLNAVSGRILELEQGEVRSYTGNYDAYLDAKVLQREQQQKAFEKQQGFVERERRWIERFRYKNTKSRQAQSRIKRLDKLETVDAPPPEAGSVSIKMKEVVRSGQKVIEAIRLSMSYDDLHLYSDVSFTVERGERVGIIGPNGTGKSTLLRQLAGNLPDGAGEVIIGHKVKLGFYDQHHEDLNPANDILTEVWASRPDWVPEQVRKFLGRLLFTGQDVFKQISALSGGERSRVALAKLILESANVLLLDEPTNHLDIASREVLEMALAEFQGSIVLVSHDRELIDRLVDKLVIIENGRAEFHLGNYSHYRWRLQEEKGESVPNSAEKTAADVMKIRTMEKKRQRSNDNERKKMRRELEELEDNIQSVESLVEEYEGRFAALDPADFEKAAALKAEYEAFKKDLEQLYAEWEVLSERLGAV
jgi:ATP-binding cassette subfamily F protein 3